MLDRRGSLAISNQKSKCGNSDNFQYYSIFYHFWNYSQHAFALSKTWLGIIYMQLLKKLFPLPNLATVLPTNPVRVLHVGIPEKRIQILQTTDLYSIKTCQKSPYKKPLNSWNTQREATNLDEQFHVLWHLSYLQTNHELTSRSIFLTNYEILAPLRVQHGLTAAIGFVSIFLKHLCFKDFLGQRKTRFYYTRF